MSGALTFSLPSSFISTPSWFLDVGCLDLLATILIHFHALLLGLIGLLGRLTSLILRLLYHKVLRSRDRLLPLLLHLPRLLIPLLLEPRLLFFPLLLLLPLLEFRIRCFLLLLQESLLGSLLPLLTRFPHNDMRNLLVARCAETPKSFFPVGF